MPRPHKCRRVCCMPQSKVFGPLDTPELSEQAISMAIDEFEAIRLIDLEGLTQEECAGRMGVARTTAQAIYNSARVKLAECLVTGKKLYLEGGNYVLCNDRTSHCGCRHCHREQHPERTAAGEKDIQSHTCDEQSE
ncbi:DUF134 domain-containing protein [Lacrimispora indolis]|uniref:DUF134 domain-containing protein n=1 Tax=Lacrimispora indolis TaxID=69825 RepID=UPI00045E930F|nr:MULTISPECIES: DUF134 domain-containing protein [Lachnospiraceae]MBE7722571.1 DUF134 domain-containing protein [Lacrimispora celerecrescens]